MKIDGKCHCGGISWSGEIDRNDVYICHCNDCQILSGGPFRCVAVIPAGSFSMEGTPKDYIKVAESGNRRIQAFCPDCGTSLYSTNADGEPLAYYIRTGMARQRAELVPTKQNWTSVCLPWLDNLGDIPRNEKS